MARIQSQRPGLPVSATCPTHIKIKVGTTFGCGVLLAGNPVNYTITITAVAGSDYTSDATPTQPIIDTTTVAAEVQRQEGGGATVTCGAQRFLQLPVNASFDCVVTRPSGSATLRLSVSDAQGDVVVGGGTVNVPATPLPGGPSGTLPGG